MKGSKMLSECTLEEKMKFYHWMGYTTKIKGAEIVSLLDSMKLIVKSSNMEDSEKKYMDVFIEEIREQVSKNERSN